MPRKPRFAPPGYYLHITQRGNYRQQTFFSDSDYLLFLNLLAQQAGARQVDVLAYCLMQNHFHLIARAHQEGNISRFMQGLAGRYAQQLHGRLARSGRLWQTRFYSCVLSPSHLVAALRYVELNPVRACYVADAASYRWSSAAIHSGATLAPDWLDLSTFGELFTTSEWRTILAADEVRQDCAAIRSATQWERPLGALGFVRELESRFDIALRPKLSGRPALKAPEKDSMVAGPSGRAAPA